MRIKLKKYDEESKIISLALDEETKRDLLEDELDFLYISEDGVMLYPQEKKFYLEADQLELLSKKNNYDVYEIWSNGVLEERYSDGSLDNFFFVTGKCNSNCIMCPSADFSRQKADEAYIDDLIEIARHIPSDAAHLTITGGEPFMAGKDIFRFLAFLKAKFVHTEFLILTNGRIFSVRKYVEQICNTKPDNCIIGIPLHGSTSEIHDGITGVDGSFLQTVSGIKNLLEAGARIELRIVLCKPNLEDFDSIAELIIDEMRGIEHVSVMAMEMTGNAYTNKEAVWVPYSDAFQLIEGAILKLLYSGIDVQLYNFPLCTVDDRFWMICEKSISPNKVRYSEECNNCRFKAECGGVFSGTYLLEKGDLKAIR